MSSRQRGPRTLEWCLFSLCVTTFVMAGTASAQPNEDVPGSGAGAAKGKRYVILVGDSGKGRHNAGKLFEMAAKTYEAAIKARPGFKAAKDKVERVRVSGAKSINKALKGDKIFELSYFGHSWYHPGKKSEFSTRERRREPIPTSPRWRSSLVSWGRRSRHPLRSC